MSSSWVRWTESTSSHLPSIKAWAVTRTERRAKKKEMEVVPKWMVCMHRTEKRTLSSSHYVPARQKPQHGRLFRGVSLPVRMCNNALGRSLKNSGGFMEEYDFPWFSFHFTLFFRAKWKMDAFCKTLKKEACNALHLCSVFFGMPFLYRKNKRRGE